MFGPETDEDPPKPTESMPAYQVVFPSYQPPPGLVIQGRDGGGKDPRRSNETPKDGFPSPWQLDDNPDKPPLSWDGGISLSHDSFKEQPNRDANA